jgi:glucokinase
LNSQESAGIIGIDIGGTNTVVGFIDEKGNCREQDHIIMSTQTDANMFIDVLASTIKNVIHKHHNLILQGIGVAAPAARHHEGVIKNPANLKWGVVDIVGMLKQYFDLPIAITNDSNAAALGELHFGSTRGMKNFIVLTLGTGLGAGIIADGRLLYGHNSMGGELGHIMMEPNGRSCGCGRKGCAETYVSATGLRRTVYELLATNNQKSILRSISYDQLTSKKIYELACAGESLAAEAFAVTGKYLGILIANAVAIFDSEAIILSGGLSEAGNLLMEPTIRSFKENALDWQKDSVLIQKSQLHNAAILGASSMIADFLAKNMTIAPELVLSAKTDVKLPL